MRKFIRSANSHIQHLFVGKTEKVGDGYDRLHDNFPYSLCNGEFKGVLLHLPEQPTDGLIVIEPLDNGEDVILQGHDGSMCDLLREVLSLTLAHAEQSLALLKDDFLRPSLGVNPVGLKEVKPGVRGDESAPLPMLGSPYEEHPATDSGELDICSYVPAPQLAAVLLRVLLVEEPDECRGGKVSSPKAVPGPAVLANLEAAEIMALDAAGVHEAYDFLACEPAVCKKIFEAYTLSDGLSHHVHCQGNLVHVIFLDSLARRSILFAVGGISCVKLFLRHPVILLPAFLPDKGEVKKHLRDTVSYAEEERLEAEDALVLKMGVDTADTLHSPARLGEVGVIDYQAGRPVFVVGTDLYTGPELEVDVVHELAPVDTRITKEAIEHVLLAAQETA